MGDFQARLRAVNDLTVPMAREWAGIHSYDGVIQDLSPDGVRRGLKSLPPPLPPQDHDEAHLATFEQALRVRLGEQEDHRRNPLLHLENLELAPYDRSYAPEGQRREARARHLAQWPDAVGMALESLDAVPAPVADALLPAVRGLCEGLQPGVSDDQDAALAAHARLARHLEQIAVSGEPDPALGAGALARRMSALEAMDVELGRLAERADAERDRMRALLDEACCALHPDLDTRQAVATLVSDHPGPAGVLDQARALTAESLRFTAERDLVPHLDGECLVGPAPESRRWAMAMISCAAPHEEDGPSWYYVTPPDQSWPAHQQDEWLAVFSSATLPAITVHEVAPGHYTHGRSLRRAPTLVRRTLFSEAFVEGWAHYAEELCLEEGFRAGDARFAAGVAIEALVRVTRLAVAIGLHSHTMTLDEGITRFTQDAFLAGPAARSEALRATFDPTYGRYTWGKLEILDLRGRMRRRWGAGYTHRRFHDKLMALGSPPLGLLGGAFAAD